MRRSTFGIVGVLVSLAVAAPVWAQPKGDVMLIADGFTGWKKAPQATRLHRGRPLRLHRRGRGAVPRVRVRAADPAEMLRASAQFTVDLYRMRDPIAATGIYLMKCGKEVRRPGFAERHTVSRHQLLFLRDRFFVIISSGSGQESLVPELVAFGGAVASKMPANGPRCHVAAPEGRPGRHDAATSAWALDGLQAIHTWARRHPAARWEADGGGSRFPGRLRRLHADRASAIRPRRPPRRHSPT